MLDENLPSFSIKPITSKYPLTSSVTYSENGSEPRSIYSLRKPDPSFNNTKNCYAIALYDSHSPEILYCQVLVKPTWSQPTASTTDIREQNGILLPLIPVVPENFVIQLCNPDHGVTVKQVAGKWNNSTYWKFEMPVNSFRVPSSSILDQSQNAPALSESTPKNEFRWKRDGKLSRDIVCYFIGPNIDGKKHREPDITVAFFKGGKVLTLYEPNLRRVEVEDKKGLEVVLLLSAVVIKDIFFNASREMFNIVSSKDTNPISKNNSGNNVFINGTPAISDSIYSEPTAEPMKTSTSAKPLASLTVQRSKKEIDLETERLKKLFIAEKERQEKEEKEQERKLRDMLKSEEEELRLREAAIEKETERLRKEYGTSSTADNASGVNENPALEAKKFRLTGVVLPSVLRAPQKSSLLEAVGWREQKTGNEIHPPSSSTGNAGNGLLNIVQKVQKKKSFYLS